MKWLWGFACLLCQVCAVAAPTENYLNFAAQADGSPDFVEVADAPALNLSGGAFTLSAWINPATWGDNSQGRILDHGGGAGAQGWTLHIEDKRTGVRGGLRMQINNDKLVNMRSDANIITLNSWQHIAVTLAGGTLTYYVDGQAAGTRTGVPTPLPSADSLRIGIRSGDFKRAFTGGIDEVSIWDRALSATEIQTLLSGELGGGEAGLVAYYPFNEGAGQVAADQSGNGRDGRLGSTADTDSHDPAWHTSVIVNQPPLANAGADQAIILPDNSVTLAGAAIDDGLPGGQLSASWHVDSGPGSVSFANPFAVDTTASFSVAGTYVLRLHVDDGELSADASMTVTVYETALLTELLISPDFARLQAGETQQFSASGFDQTGAPFPVSPAWSATAGSVDAGGLYSAAGSPGNYTVTATAGGISAQATVTLFDASLVWPTQGWHTATPAEMGMDQLSLEQARDYALTGSGSGMITRGGRLVMAWGSPTDLYDMKSTTKSIGATVLGLALQDGLVQLDAPAQLYLPEAGTPPEENLQTGWLGDITLLQLATHTAGFEKTGRFGQLLFEPGTAWSYSDGGANWLADLLTVTYSKDLKSLMLSRVFAPLGITEEEFTWRNNTYRGRNIQGDKRREFGSGTKASVDAMARLGYLYLRNGQWQGQTIIPESFVAKASRPIASVSGLPVIDAGQYPDAASHYGLLWWNNADATLPNVPTDAYWAWGLLDSVIIVIPSLDIVAVRAGGGWRSGWNSDYSVIEPFIEPIALAATDGPINRPPAVAVGANQSITLPLNTVDISATVNDDGLPDNSLSTSWSLFAGPAPVNFADPTALNTAVTFSQAGTYQLMLTASDGALSASDSLTVVVSPPPDTQPPAVSLTAPLQGSTLAGLVSLAASASDDNAVATVTFALGGTTLAILSAPPYQANWDSSTVANGSYDISATAADAAGNTSSVSVTVTVDNGAPVNQPPLVDAGGDRTLRLPTDSLSLDGSVSDDGLGGSLSSTWSLTSGPAAVHFADPSQVDTVVTFTQAGEYQLSLSASDGEFNSSDSVSITVQAAPELAVLAVSPAAQTVLLNGSQQFSASGLDQYGDSIAVNPLWAAAGGSIDSSGLYTAGATAGTYEITATAGAVSGRATITVSDSVSAPTQQYLQFDGIDDFVEIQPAPALSLSAGAFTLSAWIRPSGWGDNGQGRILDHGGGGGAEGWSLHVENKRRGLRRGLRLQINNDSQVNMRSDAEVLALDTWQHIAVTVDAGTLTFYVDGQLAGIRTGIPAPVASTDPLRIGARATDLRRGFEGAIDEVRIWERALSQAEIQAGMSTELSGGEADLVAYYRLNEGAGQSAGDHSGNGHGGVLGTSAGIDSSDPLW